MEPTRPAAAVAAVAVLAPAAVLAGRPAPGDIRGCKTRAEGSRPAQRPAGGIRLGPLTVWPSIRRTFPTGDTEWPFAAKAPILLEARTRVVLAIAPDAATGAGLARRGGGYAAAVRFEACREREPSFGYRGTVGRLTAFPFAIALEERSACVPVELWVDGRDRPLRTVLPVGRRSC